MKKKLFFAAVVIGIGVGIIVVRSYELTPEKAHSRAKMSGTAPGAPVAAPASATSSRTNSQPVVGNSAPASKVTSAPSREFDPAINPYASALREPAKSKRAWDTNFLTQITDARQGAPIRFDLTGGAVAVGKIQIAQHQDGELTYVSGELTGPEPGKFFFLKPPTGGKAGVAVGVVEFWGSKTAYRIEPTGPDGAPELRQRRLDEVVCLAMPLMAEALTNTIEEAPPLRPDQVPDYLPPDNTDLNGNVIVSLQSKPGAPAVVLLDFFGGYTPTWGGVSYPPPNVGNAAIKDLWKRVAEDYMPFNINVTTDVRVYQNAPISSRQKCVYSPSISVMPASAAGVAYVGSWNWGNDSVCWSIYCVGKAGAEVGAHEVGHTVGLGHQTTSTSGYFGGQGSGVTGWAPIMGGSYYANVSQWAKGEYQDAQNLQDELATVLLFNGITYRADDTGATLAAARYLEIYPNYSAFAEGVIETTGDTDAFRFTTAGGVVSLTASPVGDWANLAVMVTLANGTDTVIASNNPQTVLSAAISANVPAGTYTFRVAGAGRNNPLTDGFSSYASLGYYSVTGSVSGAVLPTRLAVAENSTNGTVAGTVPPNGAGTLAYSIVSGNTGNTFALNNSGVLTVANASVLNYEALALNTQLTVQYELFVNITNLSNPSLTETNRRVVVQILDVNEPPALSGLFTNTVAEHLPIGLPLGTVSATDPDFWQVPQFSIIGGNAGGKFSINPVTGLISVAGDLDATVQTNYQLTIAATDNPAVGFPLVTTGIISITVVSSAPVTWTGGGVNNNWSTPANWSSLLPNAGGRVIFGNAARQANVNDSVSSLGWFQFTGSGFSISGNPLILLSGLTNSGNNTWGLATTLNANQPWNISSGTLTANNPLSGPGGLIISGAGQLNLASGSSTFAGDLIVQAGTLNITSGATTSGSDATALGKCSISGRSIAVNAGATLMFSANDSMGNGAATPKSTLNIAGLVTSSGAFFQTFGPVILNGGTLSGLAGVDANYQMYSFLSSVTVTGSAPSTITSGGGTFNAIHLGSQAKNLTTFIVGDVTGNANADLTILVPLTDRNISQGGGAGGLQKTGEGTLYLTKNNTYTGPTLVSAGELRLSGSLTTNSTVTVAGGTLSGTGTIKGPVLVESGGQLAPGNNGIGILNINNTLNLSGTVVCEISKVGLSPVRDRVQGITTFTMGGALIVTNIGQTAFTAGNTFSLFGATSFQGDFASVALPTLSAGLIWDATSLPVNGSIAVVAQPGGSPPSTPTGVTATMAGATQIQVTWSAPPGATSYIVNRDGNDVGIAGGSGYLDAGLPLNSSHCYTVTAVSTGGNSAPTSQVCGDTAPSGSQLTWDANTSNTGAQDGSGTWNASGTNWWNGSRNIPWFDNNTAVFGVNTPAAQAVSLTTTIAPSGLTFNNTTGEYTVAGANEIQTVNNILISVAANATIDAPITGSTGTVTKTGVGQLTLPTTGNTFTGDFTVQAGTVLVSGGALGEAPASSAFGDVTVAGRKINVNTGGKLVFANNDIFGNALASPALTLNIAGGAVTNSGAFFQTLGPVILNGGTLSGGAGFGSTYQMYSLNDGVTVEGSSPSTMLSGPGTFSGIHLGTSLVRTCPFTVANVTGDANPDLTVSAMLVDQNMSQGGGAGGLSKSGAGTMVLARNNTYTGPTLVNAGELRITGSLASGSTVTVAGGTLSGTGTINGPVVVGNGGQLAPGNNGIGVLNINKTLNLNGAALFEISKNGTSLNRDRVQGITTLTMGGSLTVTHLGPTALAAGDAFSLFGATSYQGAFTSVALPSLPVGLSWDTSLLQVAGTITVADPVAVTSPMNGDVFFTVQSPTATATVAYGTGPYTVTYHTNYNGGAYTSAGAATTPTYAVSLGALAVGTHSIYATVTDSASQTRTSVTNTFSVVAVPPSEVINGAHYLSGVTVNSFSSETTAPVGYRAAANTVNGSGLNTATGQHDEVAVNEWMTVGTALTGNGPRRPDPLPGPYIVYDLGGLYDLSTIRVWNFSEGGDHSGNIYGVQSVVIATSATTTFGAGTTNTFSPDTNDMGADYVFSATKVRYIKFAISSNYGGGASLVGLAEVRFQGLPAVMAVMTPPVLSGALWVGPGSVALSGTGATNQSYSVWSSTNVALPMAQWSLIGTTNSDGGGVIQFLDSNATNKQQFYRFGR